MASSRASTFITVGEDYVAGNKNVYYTITPDAVAQRAFNPASPYVGLARFDAGRRDLFFGRERLVQKLLASLQQSRGRILLGVSGSGKSSVVRAGLIPDLEETLGAGFRAFSLFPDINPFESLRSSLHDPFSQSDTAPLLAPPHSLLKLVRRLQRPGEQWLFFIDQLEELFIRSEEKYRAPFLTSLCDVVADTSCAVRIFAALRSDFFDRLSAYPDFARLVETSQDIVTEMDTEELRRAIAQPAARHGVVFPSTLADEIISAVQGQPGCLPLLQYTLDLLWRSSTDLAATRRISEDTYRRLGGVLGALEQRAQDIYDLTLGDPPDAPAAKSLSPFARLAKPPPKTTTARQDAARQILLRLVDFRRDPTAGAVWRPVRRRVPRAQFAATGTEADVLKLLVDEKLLVSGDAGTVEVAHEALFTAWRQLHGWIAEGEDVILEYNRLVDDAARWQDRLHQADPEAGDELLGGSRLAQVNRLTEHDAFRPVVGEVSPAVTAFLAASREHARLRLRERRWVRVGLYSAVAAIVVAVLVNVFNSYRAHQAEANNQRILISDAWSTGQGERGPLYAERSAVGATHHLLQAAALHQERGEADDAAAAVLAAEVAGARLVATLVHPDDIAQPIVSGDGQHVLLFSKSDTDDQPGVARIFRASDGAPESDLLRHPQRIGSGFISRDGTRVLLGTPKGGSVTTWQRPGGTPGLVWLKQQELPRDPAFPASELSPDGAWVLRQAADLLLTPALQAFAGAQPAATFDKTISGEASFSPDNLHILARNAETAFVLDAASRRQLGPALRPGPNAESLLVGGQFVAGGRAVLLQTALQTTLQYVLYDLSGSELGRFDALECNVSPDFQHLALTRAFPNTPDHDVDLVQLGPDGRPLSAPQTIMSNVSVDGVCFSPDGSRLAVWGADGVVQLRDASTGAPLGSLNHGRKIAGFAFDAASRQMLTYDKEAVSIWKISNLHPVLTLPAERGIQYAAFVADGTRVLIQEKGHLARLWAVTAGREAGEIVAAASVADASSADPDLKDDSRPFAERTRDIPVEAIFAGDDQLALVAQNGKQSLRRLPGGEIVFAADHPIEFSFHPDRSEDGQTISFGGPQPRNVASDLCVVWQLGPGAPRELKREFPNINGSAVSPDGRRVVMWSKRYVEGRGRDRTALLGWDLARGDEAIPSVQVDAEVYRVVFSRDGRFLLVKGMDGFALLRWPPAGSPEVVPLDELKEAVDASLSRDGQYLAGVQRAGRVVVRRLGGDGGSFVLPSADAAAVGAAFSPDGRRLALWSERDFRIWDMDSHRLSLPAVAVPEEQVIERVSFSADGGLALLECHARSDQGEKRVRLYRLKDGRPVGTTIAFFAGEGRKIALNAPGTLLLTVEDDSVAKIRSTRNGQCLAAWSHNATVSKASFSRDGRRVLLSCRDGTVRTWELGFDATVSIAQRRLEFEVRSGATLPLDSEVRPLSLAEWESHRRDLLREEIASGKVLNYLGEVHPLSAAELAAKKAQLAPP